MISVSERTLITAHGTCFSAGIEEEQGTSVKSTRARQRAGRACAKYHRLVQTYTRKTSKTVTAAVPEEESPSPSAAVGERLLATPVTEIGTNTIMKLLRHRLLWCATRNRGQPRRPACFIVRNERRERGALTLPFPRPTPRQNE